MFSSTILVFLISVQTVLCYIGFGTNRAFAPPAERFDSKVNTGANFFGNKLRLKQSPASTIPKPKTESSSSIASEKFLSLPWSKSVSPDRELVYMPMLEAQLRRLEGMGMERIPLEDDFSYRTSKVKPAKVGCMCFKNEQFRKVRMTYFDAGDAVQVFNTLWYPSLEYDLPLLGIDLISLGKGRILTVMDFQPLQPTEEYSNKYIEHLTDLKDKYPDLQGKLSGKIYDDTSFFSKNMLFGRFTDESKLKSVVLPAFEEYIDAYLNLMKRSTPKNSPEDKLNVLQRQAAYDQYYALKDPAVGLFDAYFGKDWSENLIHNFLFTLSDGIENSEFAKNHVLKAKPSHSSQKPIHNFKIDSNTGDVTVVTSLKNQ